jgi:general secretion pathway protein G
VIPVCVRIRQTGGSKLYEFVWVVLLVGILSMVVLDYMLRYIEIAEKGAMENTVVNLRSALRLRLAEELVRNDAKEAMRLAHSNPMEWLYELPSNYAGEFTDPEPGSIMRGKWYWNRGSRELVYLVDNGRDFTPDSEGLKRVRYRVHAPFLAIAAKENRQMSVNDVVAEISLVLAEPYRWEFK